MLHDFNGIPDEDLIKINSDEAFSEILERWSKRIFSFINKRVIRKELAEEITQEVFIKVYKGRDTWNSDFKFSSWIYTIAKNSVITSYRNRISKNEIICDEKGEEGCYFEDLDSKILLEKSLENIPKDMYNAFYISCILGMDHNEAAAHENISPENLRKRLSRAREYLKAFLEN
jgi:RNA polymerase sigma-70 factor (ECF subfamily)